MSGEYAKIFKRIWGDPDFKTLNIEEQALYIKLFSQTDISMAGVLTLATTRWATQTDGLTVPKVEKTLRTLEQRGYIVTDPDTQEVLLRSYIRNDGGWVSNKTLIGVTNAVRRVLSPRLRSVISEELLRLDLTLVRAEPLKNGTVPRDVTEREIGYLLAENPLPDTPSDGVSHGVSDTPSDGVNRSTLTTTTATPTATTTNTPANAPSGYTPDFEDWWTQYPVKAGKTNAFVAWKKAIKKTSLNELHQGLGRYKQHLMLNPDVSIKHAQGWLNDERWTDEYPDRPRNTYKNQNQIINEMQDKAAQRTHMQQSVVLDLIEGGQR